MAQEANSWDPGSIPGRDTSFDVPESSCLLSGPWLQLDSRYTGSRGWFGGSSGMPSAGEEDSVTGTLKHVKSSVARSGGIVLRLSSGYGAGGHFLRPGFDPRSRHIFWRPWIFLSPLWPLTPTGFPLQWRSGVEFRTGRRSNRQRKMAHEGVCAVSCATWRRACMCYVTTQQQA